MGTSLSPPPCGKPEVAALTVDSVSALRDHGPRPPPRQAKKRNAEDGPACNTSIRLLDYSDHNDTHVDDSQSVQHAKEEKKKKKKRPSVLEGNRYRSNTDQAFFLVAAFFLGAGFFLVTVFFLAGLAAAGFFLAGLAAAGFLGAFFLVAVVFLVVGFLAT